MKHTGMLFLLLAAAPFTQALHAASVPFVGCPSDGQLGPVAAPKVDAAMPAVPAAYADSLAWYKAENGPGVLAPKGWHCFGTYGSSGATLYVAPAALDGGAILSGKWNGLDGPAIEISSMSGSTSGRFEVAHQVSRYFPQHKDFATKVIAEHMDDAASYRTGPFAQDTVRHTGNDVVEFKTPAGAKGQGTESMLTPPAEPISGFVRVSFQPDEDPYDVALEVRLPEAQKTLVPVIVKTTETASLKR